MWTILLPLGGLDVAAARYLGQGSRGRIAAVAKHRVALDEVLGSPVVEMEAVADAVEAVEVLRGLIYPGDDIGYHERDRVMRVTTTGGEHAGTTDHRTNSTSTTTTTSVAGASSTSRSATAEEYGSGFEVLDNPTGELEAVVRYCDLEATTGIWSDIDSRGYQDHNNNINHISSPRPVGIGEVNRRVDSSMDWQLLLRSLGATTTSTMTTTTTTNHKHNHNHNHNHNYNHGGDATGVTNPQMHHHQHPSKSTLPTSTGDKTTYGEGEEESTSDEDAVDISGQKGATRIKNATLSWLQEWIVTTASSYSRNNNDNNNNNNSSSSSSSHDANATPRHAIGQNNIQHQSIASLESVVSHALLRRASADELSSDIIDTCGIHDSLLRALPELLRRRVSLSERLSRLVREARDLEAGEGDWGGAASGPGGSGDGDGVNHAYTGSNRNRPQTMPTVGRVVTVTSEVAKQREKALRKERRRGGMAGMGTATQGDAAWLMQVGLDVLVEREAEEKARTSSLVGVEGLGIKTNGKEGQQVMRSLPVGTIRTQGAGYEEVRRGMGRGKEREGGGMLHVAPHPS